MCFPTPFLNEICLRRWLSECWPKRFFGYLVDKRGFITLWHRDFHEPFWESLEPSISWSTSTKDSQFFYLTCYSLHSCMAPENRQNAPPKRTFHQLQSHWFFKGEVAVSFKRRVCNFLEPKSVPINASLSSSYPKFGACQNLGSHGEENHHFSKGFLKKILHGIYCEPVFWQYPRENVFFPPAKNTWAFGPPKILPLKQLPFVFEVLPREAAARRGSEKIISGGCSWKRFFVTKAEPPIQGCKKKINAKKHWKLWGKNEFVERTWVLRFGDFWTKE